MSVADPGRSAGHRPGGTRIAGIVGIRSRCGRAVARNCCRLRHSGCRSTEQRGVHRGWSRHESPPVHHPQLRDVDRRVSRQRVYRQRLTIEEQDELRPRRPAARPRAMRSWSARPPFVTTTRACWCGVNGDDAEARVSPSSPAKVTVTCSGDLPVTSAFFCAGDVEKLVYCPEEAPRSGCAARSAMSPRSSRSESRSRCPRSPTTSPSGACAAS